MKNDMFIEIAASGIGGRAELLHEPKPAEYKKKKCSLKKAITAPIATKPKMSTHEELKEELKKMRKVYAPFLADYAPKAKEYKKQIQIRDFVLNGTENITIPYYGGPVGNATQIYEAKFNVDATINEDTVAYICFSKY